MDTRRRKRLQAVRNLRNDELHEYLATLVGIGMKRARELYIQAMEEEKRISGPMIDRIDQRVKELMDLSTTLDKIGDNSND